MATITTLPTTPAGRYVGALAANSVSTYLVWDTFGERVARDAAGPLVFDSAADAAWYAGELNNLRTPAEIAAGI